MASADDANSGQGVLEPGAQLRAERVLTTLLVLILFAHFVFEPVALAASWPGGWYPLLALAVPAFGLGYGVWLLRDVNLSGGARRSLDLFFIFLVGGGGLATEAMISAPSVAASVTNAGFSTLAACTYVASFRLSRRVSGAVVLMAALGHAGALRATPTEAIEGSVQLVVMWVATRIVVAQVRRAGCDAEGASEAARRAEREEASARVHDALGLLRVVARGDGAGEGVQRAVRETVRRTHMWLGALSGVPHLARTVEAVAGQFPDLEIGLEVDTLSAVVDPELVTVVGRAVHTLLGNVREHAGAARVQIMGFAHPMGWTLTIRDDGRGFDIRSVTRRMGLTRYTHAALVGVGVTMDIDSAPGLGTTVTLQGSLTEEEARREPAVGGGFTAGRFVSWSSRPQDGVARALWISDVIQAGLVASFAVLAVAGYGYLLNHSERPAVAGVLVIAGVLSLALTWLGGPRPSKAAAVSATVFAVTAGAIVTVLNGPHAATGDKLGIMLTAWSCMLLAVARPDCCAVAVGLSLVPLAVLARVDPIAGVATALWVALASLFAARLVTALTTLGSEADADRRTAADLERRSAARVLLEQASAMGEAADGGMSDVVRDRLTVVARKAEGYLRRSRPCSLGVRVRAALGASSVADRVEVGIDDLDADLAPEAAQRVVDAVTEIASILAGKSLDSTVRVRGASTSTQWQVTLLVEAGRVAAADAQALIPQRLSDGLEAVAIGVTARPVPGGGFRVELRPTQSQNRQELAIDVPPTPAQA